MLPRRSLLAHAGLSVAAIVISAGVTTRFAAATNGTRQRNDPKPKHRRENRHDQGGRRRSDSAKMVPM